MDNSRTIIAAYGQWIREQIEQGRNAYMVTFMFNPLSGSTTARWAQMVGAIEQLYAKILTRTFREPNAARNLGNLPMLVFAPDFPVYKLNRDRISDIAINAGLHAHGIWTMPRRSRMVENLSDHLSQYSDRYAGAGRPIARIHSQPIMSEPGYVMDYVAKSTKTSRAAVEDIVTLPRSRSEI